MRRIYLDYNATTPIAPEVVDAMGPFLSEHFGNPSSSHALGRAASEAIEDARGQVAAMIGADRDEILFTSCATESNNLALWGVMTREAPPFRGHLVISSFEHPAIAEPARYLEKLGFAVARIPCSPQGQVDLKSLVSALEPTTKLVSVMHANNEIGTVQPIREIAEICRRHEILFHTDASQSAGKIPIDVEELGVDLLTIAGHKLYAPKGIGALYVRRGVSIVSLMHGAGHESGLRPGTENTPYIVGLGTAATLAAKEIEEFRRRTQSLKDRLLERLREGIDPNLAVNGEGSERLPNTLSVNFPNVSAGELLRRVPELMASTGAACHDGHTKLSDTLHAIGLNPEVAQGTMRLSLGRYSTEEEIDRAASLLISAWDTLR